MKSQVTGGQKGRSFRTLLLAVAIEPQEIGSRIKEARLRKGWTQLDLALEAKVSVSSVQRWEAGELPPIRRLMKLAPLLGISVDALVESDENPTTPADLVRVMEALEAVTVELNQAVVALQGLREDAPPQRKESGRARR